MTANDYANESASKDSYARLLYPMSYYRTFYL